MTVGFRCPLSRPLRYCWLKPDRSSISSWVSPFSLRRREKFWPTSLRISMQKGWQIIHYSVINYNMYFDFETDWYDARLAKLPMPETVLWRQPSSRCFGIEHYFTTRDEVRTKLRRTLRGRGDCSVNVRGTGTDRLDPAFPEPRAAGVSCTVRDPPIIRKSSESLAGCTATYSLRGD